MKRYERLTEEITASIRSGLLQAGDRLPSVRQTSASRGVSPSTVFKAYYLLEARGLIRDWARVGLSGHYAAAGMPVDLEAAMHALALPVKALLFDTDWLAPAGSMRHLLSKMPAAPATLRIMSGNELGARADHFSWMKSPAIVADGLL